MRNDKGTSKSAKNAKPGLKDDIVHPSTWRPTKHSLVWDGKIYRTGVELLRDAEVYFEEMLYIDVPPTLIGFCNYAHITLSQFGKLMKKRSLVKACQLVLQKVGVYYEESLIRNGARYWIDMYLDSEVQHINNKTEDKDNREDNVIRIAADDVKDKHIKELIKDI